LRAKEGFSFYSYTFGLALLTSELGNVCLSTKEWLMEQKVMGNGFFFAPFAQQERNREERN